MTNAKLRPVQGMQIDLSKKYMWDPSVAQEYVDLCQQIATDFEISLEDAQAYAETAIENGKKTENDRIAVEQYRVEVENIATEVEENRVLTQAAATSASTDADEASAARVAALASQGACASYEQSARESAQNSLNYSTTAEVKAMESEEAALRAEQAATEAGNITVFSINEASKDASGSPSFMSVSGEQITFNGAVKYTQANGESKEYASVNSIAIEYDYYPFEIPLQTSNTSPYLIEHGGEYNATYEAWKAFDGLSTTAFLGTNGKGTEDNFLKRHFDRMIKCDGLSLVNRVRDDTYSYSTAIEWYRDAEMTDLIGTATFTGAKQEVKTISAENTTVGGLYLKFIGNGGRGEYNPNLVSADLLNTFERKISKPYVMLNNGVASVVPALEVQQSEPVGRVYSVPLQVSYTSPDIVSVSSAYEASAEGWRAYDSSVSTAFAGGSTTNYLRRIHNTPFVCDGVRITNFLAGSNIGNTKTINWYKDSSKTELLATAVNENGLVKNVVELLAPNTLMVEDYFEFPDYYGSYTPNIVNIEYINPRTPLAAQTVWFNPYNNQAKQYNGTDWVDYNGVPVGKIYDGQTINFCHNTYANLLPELFTSNMGEQLLDSYVNGSSFYDVYAKNVNGDVKYWCEQGGDIISGTNILLVEFLDINYKIITTAGYSSGGVDNIIAKENKKTSSFEGIYRDTSLVFQYMSMGHCNKPEEIL